MNKPLLLLAEDDASHRKMLRTLLSEWGYDIREAANGQEAVSECLRRPTPDLALMDVRMPQMTGLEALPNLLAQSPKMPVILMTAFSDLEAAVRAIRIGAWDYVAKPLDFAKLKNTLALALQQSPQPNESNPKFPLLGKSDAIQSIAHLVEKVGPTEATVLITGESGTGKELAARAVHNASKRSHSQFIAINCGAFGESLLTSELFGHERGAFTGADRKHEGIFVKAAGGTIFLDEVGEMPLNMQVKLLRVLQEREVLPVGASRPIPIDCRVIAATNKDLSEAVATGEFREDLFYRLNVVTLSMPPLRNRDGDIALLAKHFAKRFAQENSKSFLGITPQAIQSLEHWHWPGNVRELINVMERAIILMSGEYIGERELPEHMQQEALSAASHSPNSKNNCSLPTLEEVEKQVILETLRRLNNNKTETAKALGITRKTLHAKLNRYIA